MNQRPPAGVRQPLAVLILMRVYAAFLGGLCLLYTASLIWIALFEPLEDDPDSEFLGIYMGVFSVVALALAAVYLAWIFLPPRPWVWIYGTVLIALGMTGCCTLPVAVALLIVWLQQDVRAWHGFADAVRAAPGPDLTALVLLVPEAEPLVSPFRERHDPSASKGMPAHITLLYPFVAPSAVTTEVTDRLDALLGPIPPFEFRLAGTGRFPGVLHMPPRPDGPFLDLIRGLAGAFPECPPYGGAFEEPSPHLTIAITGNPEDLDRIEEAIRERMAGQEVRARCREISLMTRSAGRWREWYRFRLGWRLDPRGPGRA